MFGEEGVFSRVFFGWFWFGFFLAFEVGLCRWVMLLGGGGGVVGVTFGVFVWFLFTVESAGCIAGMGLVLFLQHTVPGVCCHLTLQSLIWVLYCLFFM